MRSGVGLVNCDLFCGIGFARIGSRFSALIEDAKFVDGPLLGPPGGHLDDDSCATPPPLADAFCVCPELWLPLPPAPSLFPLPAPKEAAAPEGPCPDGATAPSWSPGLLEPVSVAGGGLGAGDADVGACALLDSRFCEASGAGAGPPACWPGGCGAGAGLGAGASPGLGPFSIFLFCRPFFRAAGAVLAGVGELLPICGGIPGCMLF